MTSVAPGFRPHLGQEKRGFLRVSALPAPPTRAATPHAHQQALGSPSSQSWPPYHDSGPWWWPQGESC